MTESTNPMGVETDSLSQMMTFLEREEAPTVEAEPETPVVEAQAEEVEETPVEVEPEFDLTWNGENRKLKKAELIELAQKGFDYTKKTQDVAEQRKAVEAERAAIENAAKLQQKFSKDLGELNALDYQLEQYKNVDWAALENADPSEAQKHWRNYTLLRDKRNERAFEVQQQQQRYAFDLQQKAAKQTEEALSQLKSDIPDWSSDKVKTLREFGLKQGFHEDDFNPLEVDQASGMPLGINRMALSPALIKVLHKAYLYDQLQAKKPLVDKKVADKPAVVKPGAAQPKAVQKQDARREQMDKLRKTGDQNLAAKLIESMI